MFTKSPTDSFALNDVNAPLESPNVAPSVCNTIHHCRRVRINYYPFFYRDGNLFILVYAILFKCVGVFFLTNFKVFKNEFCRHCMHRLIK